MKITFTPSRYSLEQVKDNFWLLAIMYRADLHTAALELTKHPDKADEVVSQSFFTLSFCTLNDYKSLEQIKERLDELVIIHAKRFMN